MVSSVLVGNNSGSIPATNGTFGDPCSGTVKLLAVEAAYGPSLPLTLLSFTGNSLANGDIRLSWQTANEYLTDRFLVEASANASSFTGLGQVAAAGRGGNRYSFTIQAPLAFADGFYRLKMQDVDERFTYSPIIHVRKSAEPASGFRVVTNPISTILRIAGLSGPGRAILLSAHGSLLQQVSFSGDRLDMDMGKYASGLYIIRIQNNQEWITRKLVKE